MIKNFPLYFLFACVYTVLFDYRLCLLNVKTIQIRNLIFSIIFTFHNHPENVSIEKKRKKSISTVAITLIVRQKASHIQIE